MRADHTEGPGTESSDGFTTGNYAVLTQSRVEWHYVAEDGTTPQDLGLEFWPAESTAKMPDRRRCRARAPLIALLATATQHNKRLTAACQPELVLEEVVAARLYTGPMFVKCTPSLPA